MEKKMSKKKSKFPDLQEVLNITGKFLKDVKKSLCEIVSEYKKTHDTKEKHTPRSSSKKTTPKKTPKKSD